MILYKIIIPATPGMMYIGQTNSFDRRWNEHTYSNAYTLIARALQAYGKQTKDHGAATMIPIGEAATREEMNTLEINAIKEGNTIYPKGYNLHPGGSSRKKGSSNWDMSDSRELCEAEENDPPERNHKEPVTYKIVGNIIFKHQFVKTFHKYLLHRYKKVKDGTLRFTHKPRTDKYEVHGSTDWVPYLEQHCGEHHQIKNNNGPRKIWLLSQQELDALIETVLSEFNSQSIMVIE
jgi:hypothetical protein